jgi:capsule polysaccharide export protein KpsC/LpsZ
MGAGIEPVENSNSQTVPENSRESGSLCEAVSTSQRAYRLGYREKWQAQADAQRIPLWRMEDGFIRSSGLGSDLLAPLSLVLDKTGIYYDASRPSDLENLLNASNLSERQRERASPTATTRAQQSQ